VEAARGLPDTGLLINAPRPNVIRLMPALNITAGEMERFAQLFDAAWEAIQ
jgi:acetylornithine/N-succinyldiaminopimelate aminotransferase